MTKELRDRIVELESAILDAVNTDYDEICWLDIMRDLAALVGKEFDPKLLPRKVFEENCRRYAEHIYCGVPYQGLPYEVQEVSSLQEEDDG